MAEVLRKKAAGGWLVLAGILGAALLYIAAGLGIAAASLAAGAVYWRWRLVPRQGLRGTGYLFAAVLAGAALGVLAGMGLRSWRGGTAAWLVLAGAAGLFGGAVIGIRRLWQPLPPPPPQD